jgi:hypothetical protein
VTQLTLLEPAEPDRTLTAAQAGLKTNLGDGRERLLAALVKHGLQREDLPDAAFLILSWDAHAPVDPDYRICVCGCGRTLRGRRANAKHFDGACRVRALRARGASTRSQSSPNGDVTVPGPPTALREAA